MSDFSSLTLQHMPKTGLMLNANEAEMQRERALKAEKELERIKSVQK